MDARTPPYLPLIDYALTHNYDLSPILQQIAVSPTHATIPLAPLEHLKRLPIPQPYSGSLTLTPQIVLRLHREASLNSEHVQAYFRYHSVEPGPGDWDSIKLAHLRRVLGSLVDLRKIVPETLFAFRLQILPNNVRKIYLYPEKRLISLLKEQNLFQNPPPPKAQRSEQQLMHELVALLAEDKTMLIRQTLEDTDLQLFYSELGNENLQFLDLTLVKLLMSLKYPKHTNARSLQSEISDLLANIYLDEAVNQRLIVTEVLKILKLRKKGPTIELTKEFFQIFQDRPTFRVLNEKLKPLQSFTNPSHGYYETLVKYYNDIQPQDLDSAIHGMLRLIFQHKERLGDAIQQFFKRVDANDILKHFKMEPRFDALEPKAMKKKQVNQFERSLIASNAKKLLKLMHNSEIMIPEILGYLVVHAKEKGVPAMRFSLVTGLFELLEKNEQVGSLISRLLESGDLIAAEGKSALTRFRASDQKSITLSEQEAIFERVEALNSMKARFRVELSRAFAESSLKQFMTDLQELGEKHSKLHEQTLRQLREIDEFLRVDSDESKPPV